MFLIMITSNFGVNYYQWQQNNQLIQPLPTCKGRVYKLKSNSSQNIDLRKKKALERTHNKLQQVTEELKKDKDQERVFFGLRKR